MADREVPIPIPCCQSDAYDVSVLTGPAWAECRQVRVTCFKVDRDLLVLRQVRELGWDDPVILGTLVHLRSNQNVLLEEFFLAHGLSFDVGLSSVPTLRSS